MNNNIQLSIKPREVITIVQEKLSYAGVISTCINCENSDIDKGICKLFNQTPPMKIIAQGCDNWELFIPF